MALLTTSRAPAGRAAVEALVATSVAHHDLAAVGTARSVRLRAEDDAWTTLEQRRLGHRGQRARSLLALDEPDGRSRLAREEAGAEEAEDVVDQRLRHR